MGPGFPASLAANGPLGLIGPETDLDPGHRPLAHIFQGQDDLCDFGIEEYTGKAHVVQIREGAFPCRRHASCVLRMGMSNCLAGTSAIGGKDP